MSHSGSQELVRGSLANRCHPSVGLSKTSRPLEGVNPHPNVVIPDFEDVGLSRQGSLSLTNQTIAE